MEKDRGTRVLALCALFVGVFGLSIGFAAFSNTLNISTTAKYTADDTQFDVDFFADDEAKSTTLAAPANVEVTGVGEGTDKAAKYDLSEVEIDNTTDGAAPTITGLNAEFTAPGQTVTYTFYAVNIGLYDAHLKSINAAKVKADDYIVCTPVGDADATYVANACKDISLSVQVGSLTPLVISGNTGLTGNTDSISNHVLAKDESDNVGDADTITVTITYDGDADSQRVDGDFTVQFGDVSLVYASV